jgi:hypothetical protein
MKALRADTESESTSHTLNGVAMRHELAAFNTEHVQFACVKRAAIADFFAYLTM